MNAAARGTNRADCPVEIVVYDKSGTQIAIVPLTTWRAISIGMDCLTNALRNLRRGNA